MTKSEYEIHLEKHETKDVSDGQLYKQAGNSVTVSLIKKVAINIKKSLEL